MKYIIKLFNIEIRNIICNLKSDVSKIENNITKICECNTNFKQFIAKYKTQIQEIRGIVPDITIESSKTDNESKDNQGTKKETIDEIASVLNLFISADHQMKYTEAEECTANIYDDTSNSFTQPDNETKITDDKELMDTTEFTSQSKFEKQLAQRTSVVARFKSIIFLFLILFRTNITIIIEKIIPSKLIMITAKIRKDKKPEDIQVTKNEIYRKCSLCFTILLISFLFISLLLLYFNFGLPYIKQNEKCADIFAPDIVELENEILDHDKIIRVLTEYFQQDTPLLKVVALISNASFDKLYTIDIIRNKFARRSGNERVSLYPSFTVLENLKLRNSKVVIDFAEMCQRVYPHDQQVTILADFKIDDDLTHIDLNQAINTLKKTFIRANINIKFFFTNL